MERFFGIRMELAADKMFLYISSHLNEAIHPEIDRHANIPAFVSKPDIPNTAINIDCTPNPSRSDRTLYSRLENANWN